MLQRLREQIQACHESAAAAKLRADAAADPDLRAAFLDMEKRWLTLARSYAFTESLGQFTAAMSDWRRKQAPSEPLPLTDRLFWRWKQAPRERLLTDPLFDLLPVAINVCDPDGLILFTTAAPPNSGVGLQSWATLLTDFAARTACIASKVALLHTLHVLWPRRCEPAFL